MSRHRIKQFAKNKEHGMSGTTNPSSNGVIPDEAHAPLLPPNPQASLNCGVVGNCAFSALIDKMGRIVWCCLPRFDGEPVFNALLDDSDNGAVWSIELENC